MRRIKVKFFLISIAFVCGCASFTKAKESNLPVAMKAKTTKDLLEILGEPEETETSGSKQLWYYKVFSNDSRYTSYYVAVVDGDKVVSFDATTKRSHQKVGQSD